MANVFLLIVLATTLFAEVMATCSAPEGAMTFKVTFHGDWSPLAFPKQYPKFRKNAQWSPLVGAVHRSGYTMWEEGRVVSRDFRYFVNEDVTTKLVNSIKRSPDASTAFLANKIKSGVGKTSKIFTATRDFHMLSFAVHIVPSPDWFVGYSKLDLCQGSEWLRKPVTFDLQPFDAGTDQGFMFTSPEFEENPFKPVTQITSSNPNHPANSFFYPQLDQLPRIAHFTISRAAPEPQSPEVNAPGPLPSISGGNSQDPRSIPSKPMAPGLPSWYHRINPHISSESKLTPVDCEVTTWGAWGDCDRTCAVGLQRRFRLVQQRPLNGGRKCDTLIEMRICNTKLALKKPQKKKCANKKMKKEKKKYTAKQMKKIRANLNNVYIV